MPLRHDTKSKINYVQMDIVDDQNRLRQQNIDYLKRLWIDFFETRYEILNNNYLKLIKDKVLDINNEDEVRRLIKDEFELLKNESGFDSISLFGAKFNYDINEFLNDAIRSQLVDRIYPILEFENDLRLTNMFRKLKITTYKLYLKELIQNNIETVNKPPEVDSYPFRKPEYINGVLEYKKRITNPHGDYSYLFQRLKIDEYIYPVGHLEFAKWLYDNKHINDQEYNRIEIDGGFVSYDKTKKKKDRHRNFNVSFGL